MSVRERHIGGRPAGRLGLGLQMLGASTSFSIDDAVRVIHAGLDAGVRLIDTADVYAPNALWLGQGERLLGEALRTWSGDLGQVVISTKGGNLLGADSLDIGQDGRPEHLKAACEASLRRLGVEAIDLYQLHSADPQVPIAESVGALADLQRAGKVHMIGLSNVGRREIGAAREVAEVVSVQSRLSIVSTRTRGVAAWCGEQGLAFLAYSPLGRTRAGELGEAVDAVGRVAQRHGCSPQRVALAWLLALGEHMLPIPGARNPSHIIDNLAAADLELSPQDLAELEADAAAPQ
jgi:aryl-alcohol dehydrogenase-like predicted oxidoreductase